MSEIRSTIRIEDGFTEPLENLTKTALHSQAAIADLTKSLIGLEDEFDACEAASNSFDLAIDRGLNVAAKTKSWKLFTTRLAILRNEIKVTENQIFDAIKVGTFKVQKLAAEAYKQATPYMEKLAKKTEGIRKTIKWEADVFKQLENVGGVRYAAGELANFHKGEILTRIEPYKKQAIEFWNLVEDRAKKFYELMHKEISLLKNSFKILGAKDTAIFYSFRIGEGFKKGLLAIDDKLKAIKNNITSSKSYKLFQNSTRMVGTPQTLINYIEDAAVKAKWAIKDLYRESVKNIGELKTKVINFANDGKKALTPYAAKAKNFMAPKLATAGASISKFLDNAYETWPQKIGDKLSDWKLTAQINLADIEKRGLGNVVVRNIKGGLKKFFTSDFSSAVKAFGKDMAKTFGIQLLGDVAIKFSDNIKQRLIDSLNYVSATIERSLDELNLGDKFETMYGQKGKAAKVRSYYLANELGESATMVGEMAAKASYQGIGTDHFERIMRFADKIGKLQMGETTEGAANTLIQNVKSGHDAGTMAQMLGGGQKMERKLRRAGFERALNRGNIDKALDIAEKIAEQAGITDEKYKAATDTLSNNYKKINNVIDNVKRKLAEIYARQLEPIVKRVKEILESEGFQIFVNILMTIFEKLGKLVNVAVNGLLDNIPTIAALLAVGVVAKLYMAVRNVKNFIEILGFAKKPVMWLLTKFGDWGLLGNLKNLNKEQVKMLAKEKAMAGLRIIGPWLGVFAAVYGIKLLLVDCLGISDDMAGILAGLQTVASNGFENFLIFCIERLPRYIALGIAKLKVAERETTAFFKNNISKFLAWIATGLLNLVKNSPLKYIFDALDIDLDSKIGSLEEWGSKKDEKLEYEIAKARETVKAIEEDIKSNAIAMPFVKATKGWEEALKTTWGDVGDKLVGVLGSIFKQGEEALKAAEGTSSNTDALVKMGEREEELKWLKAFSDRQIMSSYSSMTSNVRNVNINGMSQSSLAEMGRRNVSTIPSRARRKR